MFEKAKTENIQNGYFAGNILRLRKLECDPDSWT